MDFFPAFDAFAATYADGKAQLVWTSRPADLETPVAAMLKLKRHEDYCFLLESVEGGEIRGRYTVIGLAPDVLWRAHGAQAEMRRLPETEYTPCAQPSLEALRTLLAESAIDIPPGLPPMAAGVVGYLAYDMVRQMERLPHVNPDPVGVPDAVFMRPTAMVIFDAVADSVFFVAPVRPGARDARAAYDDALARLSILNARLAEPLPEPHSPTPAQAETAFVPALSPEEYMAMVRTAKEHIAAGDIFQVVLSQRFSTLFALPPFALYRSLRRLNPSPFLFYLDFKDFQLIGSSPEILVRLRGGTVTIRPIAGTRPRGKTASEDDALAKDLLSDPKELAEHLMLLDLGRNDVGRVAKIGSVTVTDRMAIERYSHVLHIVSNVEGQIAEGRDAIDALVAGFPAGTVSGAPKIRAMEIIDELEPIKRGFYAGCVGYFSSGGDMDTCISLRTGLVKDGMFHVQAGAGIVADSVPESEHKECETKARALMRAAQDAARYV